MKGTHLIVDLAGVRNIDALKSLGALQEVQRRVAEACQLTVVDTSGFQFRPYGATSVLVLSESHFSIHSWWEQAEAHADIFCCSERFDPTLAVSLLKSYLRAESANWAVVERPLRSG